MKYADETRVDVIFLQKHVDGNEEPGRENET